MWPLNRYKKAKKTPASQERAHKSRPFHSHSGDLELHLTCVEQPFVAESATLLRSEFLRLIEPIRVERSKIFGPAALTQI